MPSFHGARAVGPCDPEHLTEEDSRTESLEADGENLRVLERKRFQEVKWAREVVWEIP